MRHIDSTKLTGYHWKCVLCQKDFIKFDPEHVHGDDVPHGTYSSLEAGDPTVVRSVTDLPEFDEPFLKILQECGESSVGFLEPYGRVEWDRFYEMLDSFHGWDMEDMGGPADEKIRRVVRKMVREGEIS